MSFFASLLQTRIYSRGLSTSISHYARFHWNGYTEQGVHISKLLLNYGPKATTDREREYIFGIAATPIYEVRVIDRTSCT